MTKSKCGCLVTTLLAGVFSSLSWAGGDHQHRSHGAHVHGEAELTLVLEGNALEMSLESPAVNIVGFEHKAATAEQAHAVEEAEALLKSAQKLFTFSGTHCDVKEAQVDVSALENKELDHHGHHEDKHEHHHEDEHKHHAHHDDDHGHHDKGHGHDATHSEVTADYKFSCAQGAKLTSITVELLEKFPGIEEMDVMWITSAGQGAAELTAGSKEIRFR